MFVADFYSLVILSVWFGCGKLSFSFKLRPKITYVQFCQYVPLIALLFLPFSVVNKALLFVHHSFPSSVPK